MLMVSRDVTSSEVFDLSELSWTVRGGDKESISADARLPGSVYTDLQTAGILGSLYYRFIDVEYRWVSLHNWTSILSVQQGPASPPASLASTLREELDQGLVSPGSQLHTATMDSGAALAWTNSVLSG